jgi:hypothetical protein
MASTEPREPLMDVPGGRSRADRLGEMSLDRFQEAAGPAVVLPDAAPPAPPGPRSAQNYVDIPVHPGDDR